MVRFVKAMLVTVVLGVGSVACQPAPLHHWSEADPALIVEHGEEAVQAFIDAYWADQWLSLIHI